MTSASLVVTLVTYVGPYYAVPWGVKKLEERQRRRGGAASPPLLSTTLADRDAHATIAFRAACGVLSALLAWAALRWTVAGRLASLGGPTGLATHLALARASAATRSRGRAWAWAVAHAPALLLASPVPALLRALATACGAPAPAATALGAAAASSGAARLATLGLVWTPRRAAAALAGLGAAPGGVAAAAAVGGMLTGLALAGATARRLRRTAGTSKDPALAALSDAERSHRLWCACRDLLIAPLAEEAAFRGGLLPLLLLAGWGPMSAALLSSAAFGAAHTHHAVAAWWSGRASVGGAACVAAAHATTTAAFGLVASTLALRTGSLAAPLAAHVVANAVGPGHADHGGNNRPRSPGAAAFSLLIRAAPVLAVAALWPATAPARFGNAVPGGGGNALLEVAGILGRK